MKSIYYTFSVAGKEIRLILADRGSLAILLLLPILLGSLFAGLNLMLASEDANPTSSSKSSWLTKIKTYSAKN